MDRGRTWGDETTAMVQACIHDVPKRGVDLMGGWPLSSHLRDGAASALRAICGGRPWGESSLRRPQHPQSKSQALGNGASEGQKERFTPQGGGLARRGFAPLGLGYCLRKAGQAYAGCVALRSMSSMATAIRNSTMRCWGPRGPYRPFSRGATLCSPLETAFVPAGCLQGAGHLEMGGKRPKQARVGI